MLKSDEYKSIKTDLIHRKNLLIKKRKKFQLNPVFMTKKENENAKNRLY